MLYQLPNGKSIEISTEHYLRMSDEELDLYLAYNIGEEVNDPFASSVLRNGTSEFLEEDNEDFLPEAIADEEEEYIEDLTDISLEDKLYDDDFIDPDFLEE